MEKKKEEQIYRKEEKVKDDVYLKSNLWTLKRNMDQNCR